MTLRDSFTLIVDSLETPLTPTDRQAIVTALEQHARTMPHDGPVAVWHDWRIGIGGLDAIGAFLYLAQAARAAHYVRHQCDRTGSRS